MVLRELSLFDGSYEKAKKAALLAHGVKMELIALGLKTACFTLRSNDSSLWCAYITYGHDEIKVTGRKKMAYAIEDATKLADKLGWQVGPWVRLKP